MSSQRKKFFGRELSSGKLELDSESVSCKSPDVVRRLERIESNYQKLDAILTDLERKISREAKLKKKKVPAQEADSPATSDTIDSDALNLPSVDPKKPR